MSDWLVEAKLGQATQPLEAGIIFSVDLREVEDMILLCIHDDILRKRIWNTTKQNRFKALNCTIVSPLTVALKLGLLFIDPLANIY